MTPDPGPRAQPSVELAPSILASNFLRLDQAVTEVERAGVERLHVDVMDGRFVPNITVGPPIVRAIRPVTELCIEAHLMIVKPERYVEDFAEAGADLITVHAEVSPHLYRTVQHIHGTGKRAGVAINPGTPWVAVEEVLDLADLILVMTVNPGFGGQEFIAPMLHKVGRVRDELDRRDSFARLEVDGGVNGETGRGLVDAGADVLVAGTAIYRHPAGILAGVRRLREAATAGGEE